MNDHRKQADDARAKAELAGLDPSEIELIVKLVLKYGPAVYQAIAKLFHFSPAA